MRGVPSLITDIRKKVFTEVVRMAYAGNGYEAANELPYSIVPGDRPLHRAWWPSSSQPLSLPRVTRCTVSPLH